MQTPHFVHSEAVVSSSLYSVCALSVNPGLAVVSTPWLNVGYGLRKKGSLFISLIGEFGSFLLLFLFREGYTQRAENHEYC